MFGQLTPAHREEISRFILAPIIERSPPSIKHDEYLIPSHLSDGGGADEIRILAIHSLQFHTSFKVILKGFGRLLRNHKLTQFIFLYFEFKTVHIFSTFINQTI